MWTWIASAASRFLFSKQSGIMAIVLGIVAAGAGWYLVSTIQAKAALEQELRQSNANTEQLQRQLTKEMAIAKHLSQQREAVRNAPKHDGCPEPRIMRDTIRRMHNSGSE